MEIPENFTTDVPRDKEELIKFWKSSGSESGSGLQIRTGFTLAGVCALRVLLIRFYFSRLHRSSVNYALKKDGES